MVVEELVLNARLISDFSIGNIYIRRGTGSRGASMDTMLTKHSYRRWDKSYVVLLLLLLVVTAPLVC